MTEFTDSAQSKQIDQQEHSSITGAKRVLPVVLDPTTGEAEGLAKPLINEHYDAITMTYPTDTTEVYAFKLGGTGGTTVATLTLTYVDNTKALLSSVVRT